MAIDAVKRCFREFRSAENGNIAVLAAVAMLPIATVLGAALDLDKAQATKVQLQHIVDTAVLAGVGSQDIADAERIANANSASLGPCVPQFNFGQSENGVFTGHANCSVQTTIMSMFGVEEMDVTATASAARSSGSSPACMMSLDARASRAMDISGRAKIDLSGCDLLVNSTAANALNLTGSAKLSAESACVVGGISGFLGLLLPAVTPDCTPRFDAFVDLKDDFPAACDHTRFKANKSAVLSPGRYCNGLALSNGDFELQPGTYIIDGGDLKLSGMDSLVGEDVTFYLTGNNVALDWSTSGDINLSAPDTGPLAGFIVYLDPEANAASRSKWSVNGGVSLLGGIYLPTQHLQMTGSGDFEGQPLHVAIAARTLKISGASTINIAADARLKLMLPGGYQQPSGPPRLM